ncbi:hypothetical protein CA54_52800 [Symmachiella macrocystis]|uniref:SF3 helicase domain-containing protein n=1 Tax=Symmachiella macrocystis TaxID=2527985 RepID=A0A5C6B4M5_9PLAN|nr:phage/plasmid primase, P4 family [Symmachiella macrocystis]TWU06878.1 hypothetical protein CA54_52800 [Symmachiella macrocystis]
MTIEAYHGHEAQQAILATDREARVAMEREFQDANPEELHNSRATKTQQNGKRKLYPTTDLGNAMRFVDDHGENIRFCFQTGKWLIWNGKCWRQDDSGEIFRKVKLTVINMFREAYGDDSGSSHAARSQSSRSMDAIVKVSRDQRSILPENLDCDPMLFNCLNGTIELKTGELRAHRREDFITKLSPTIYTSGAKSELWCNWLSETFNSDAKLIAWLQKLFGYFLTGQTVEHMLAILFGVGANGKTTFLEAVLHAMGPDYSMQAAQDFLIEKRNDGHPCDKADLMGKRFVACVESGDGGRLNETLIKSLTGGDRIRARFMRQDFFEFESTHKLVLCTNHKPTVKGTDHGIWRRLRLIPFKNIVPEDKQDKQLPSKLRAESAAILAWLVEGCLVWQREGLTSLPAAIELATSEYRGSQDVIGAFIDDCCITGLSYRCKASQIYEAYKQWSETNGEHFLTQRKFGEAMTERGYERLKEGVKWYLGIGVLDGLDLLDLNPA